MLTSVTDFLKDQLGLSTIASNLFWAIALEAVGISALIRIALASFRHLPIRNRIYWVGMPVLIFVILLRVDRIGNPGVNTDVKMQFIVTAGDMIPTGKARYAYVSFVGDIRNLGDPTSLGGYILTAKLPNGQTLIGDHQTIPEQGFALNSGNGATEWIYGEDSLEKRTIDPIPRGARREGRLFYVFPDINSDLLRISGAVLTIAADDAWGRVYTWSTTLDGMLPVKEVRNFIGLRAQPTSPQAAIHTAP